MGNRQDRSDGKGRLIRLLVTSLVITAIFALQPASADFPVRKRFKTLAEKLQEISARLEVLNRYHYVYSPSVSIPDDSEAAAIAVCPVGTNVVGGGHHVNSVEGHADTSYPTTADGKAPGKEAWRVDWEEDGRTETYDPNVRAYAICADAAQVFGQTESGFTIP